MPLVSCQKTIARNLRQLRRDTGFSQADVAKATGITKRYYQDIEAARINLTLKTLARLARFFKITISELMRGC